MPQNEKEVDVAELVSMVAAENGKKIRLTHLVNPAISFGLRCSVPIIQKVFGNLCYVAGDRIDAFDFEKSVHLTEAQDT